MKTSVLVPILVLLFVFFDMGAQKGSDQSIVKINGYGNGLEIGAGIISGFDKSANEVFLVTALHVVGEADSVTVEFRQNRKEFPATIYKTKPELDLAVLRVSIQGTAIDFKKLVVASSSDFVQRPVKIIGHPQGSSWITTTASSFLNATDGINFTISRGDASKGYSGGGVFTNNNRLMGMMLKIGSHDAVVLDVLSISEWLTEWKVETNLWGRPKMNFTEAGIMGVGAAGIVVSLFVLESDSADLYSTYETQRFSDDPVYSGTTREQVFDDAQSKHNTAVITGVVGGVVLAAGTYLLIRKMNKRKKEKRYDGLVVVPHFNVPDYASSSGKAVTVGVTIRF